MRISAFVIACSFFLIGGCADKSPNTIRFGLASAPVTLDPRFATDATSYRIIRLVYQALVDFDESHRPIPSLATWEQRSPLDYRFHIKDGQVFHDGQPLTSEDILATYRSVLDATTASPHRGSLENIVSVEARSTLVVDFKLRRPDPLFPGLLVIGVMPAKSLHHSELSSRAPLGSGPFAVIDARSESRLLLRRLSDDQHIEFLTIKDATVRALKMLHREIDIMQGSMTPELVRWLDERSNIHAEFRPGTTFTYLGFNLKDADLGNAALRSAIAHAIDRASLTKYMFGGHARLADGLFTPDHWAGNSELSSIPYDPDKARAVLSEMGYNNDAPLEISYKTSSDHFRLRIATAIQNQLAKVGIKLNIQSYDWGTFYGDIKAGRFQMYSLSWVGLKQPDIFRYAFHSESVPPVGANRGRYHSATLDELIADAERSVDFAERAVLYREIQQVLLRDLPYVSLWFEDTTLIYNDRVRGYDTGIDGHYDGLIETQRVNRHE
ncbi:MAG: peptide/nickel transport system substrate-binding protein [Gammaproteobacteria bacterium]|jgi:peptide/nickel transport system substrate-binding protein